MKKIMIILLLMPCFLVAQDAQLEKYADSLMAAANRTDMPGTMLLIAKDGKPIIRKAYGMASLELQVAARPDHLFAIGSVSKQFTAVAILQLASQGKLNLSDDIRKYLHGFNTHGQVVTIEDLLTHTSGISSTEHKDYGDFFYSHGIYSDDKLLHYAMEHELLFMPNTDWSYNNFGFVMAAIIIERVTGMSFKDYMANNIFQPAGMTNSFIPDEIHALTNMVFSYYLDPEGKWMHHYPSKWFWAKGAGNIISCMDDMLKWDIALREEKILSKEWIKKAWAAHMLKDGRNINYGLGWTVSKNNGILFVTHGGSLYGYRTYSVHVPDKKLYLLFANFYGNEPETIPKKLLTRVLSLSYPSMVKANVSLNDYAGVYQIHRTGTRISSQISDVPVHIRLSAKNDTLYMERTAAEKAWLRPAGKDSFLLSSTETSWITFSRDENGKVNAVTTTGSFWTYGPDVFNKRVNVTWPAPVQARTVGAESLKKFAGTYYRPAGLSGTYFLIETDGNKLYRKFEGKRQELIPVSDNKFVRKGVEDISFEFKPAPDGSLILTVSALRVFDYKKIN